MSEMTTCERCGADLPKTGKIAGLCPKCLMRAGFESEHAGPGAWDPPTIADLASEFPQLELLTLIGRGGMGAVYKARQPGLDRFVALKVLPDVVSEDPAFAERFEREARVLAQLDHPGIVRVFDAGRQASRYYVMMEFIDGLNLRQIIRAGELKSPEALSIVTQVCEALQYAHDQGIVHRDIKPENILVDAKGRVKIADFGLAKLVGATLDSPFLTRSDQAMGTMHYMAPEQIRRPLSVDHRADIYSLGVVFYELLTGEVPMGAFPPPSATVAVDIRLDEVVLKSLAREPEQRYQRAGDVGTDVEAVRTSPPGAPRAEAFVASAAASGPIASAAPRGHAGHRRGTRAEGDGDSRRKLWHQPWVWLVTGCVVVPFLALVALGLVLALSASVGAPTYYDENGVELGPESLDAFGKPRIAPPEGPLDPLPDLVRAVHINPGPQPFMASKLEWRNDGPTLPSDFFDSYGVDISSGFAMRSALTELWSEYRKLERQATTAVEIAPGRLKLRILPFAKERRELAEGFRSDMMPALGPTAWYEVGAEQMSADLMPFGRQQVFVTLDRTGERSRMVVETQNGDRAEQDVHSLPLPLERFFADFPRAALPSAR